MKHQVFIVWFIIFLAWAFYRANFFFPEGVDEFLIKPLIFVLPVLYVVLIREKKKLGDLGLLPKQKDLFVDLYIGVVIGVLFALEGLLVNYLKYSRFSFSPIMASRISGGLGWFFLLNMATSLWEEILGRGYLYQRLYKLSNNQFGAAFTSSFLFLLLHVPILFTRLHLTDTSLIVYPLSILILGITNSYIFTLRKSLTLPILIHTFWNMTVALYL
ncbi:CPBP family intramembrane metalloprotease [Candidatus Gottesmanbacteria bacterium]|nr:CPBP family intramembrane metalloprotease [Candidatus Gottesmanbacteria bacterium]